MGKMISNLRDTNDGLNRGGIDLVSNDLLLYRPNDSVTNYRKIPFGNIRSSDLEFIGGFLKIRKELIDLLQLLKGL